MRPRHKSIRLPASMLPLPPLPSLPDAAAQQAPAAQRPCLNQDCGARKLPWIGMAAARPRSIAPQQHQPPPRQTAATLILTAQLQSQDHPAQPTLTGSSRRRPSARASTQVD